MTNHEIENQAAEILGEELTTAQLDKARKFVQSMPFTSVMVRALEAVIREQYAQQREQGLRDENDLSDPAAELFARIVEDAARIDAVEC